MALSNRSGVGMWAFFQGDTQDQITTDLCVKWMEILEQVGFSRTFRQNYDSWFQACLRSWDELRSLSQDLVPDQKQQLFATLREAVEEKDGVNKADATLLKLELAEVANKFGDSMVDVVIHCIQREEQLIQSYTQIHLRCGDKTSTPDRPMFEGRPKAVHNTDQFQRPMLSVPRSLPPSLTKMRSFGLGLSPLTNFSLAGSDISSNRTYHARRSLKFDEETAVHEHRTSIFQDHRRSFSDFFVPKLSGQHSSAHITSIPNTYPVIDGIEGEHSLNKLQHSDAFRKEPYPNCTLSGYPYSSNSLGSIAACFTRIPNALIKPIFLKEERMENPNRVETSSQREAIVSKTWNKPHFRDEADEAVFYLVTKYLENPDMKW